jgi:type I restriction-modification system DNA methylase subunit
MTTKETALQKVQELVIRFNEQLPAYKKIDYNETQTRRDFIDPFFKALGWDIDNKQGFGEAYREVIHEDKVKVGHATKAPDYSFRLGGGKRLFFVEAKKPSILIKEDLAPAYQVRRYGWSAKLNISIITDFEEFAVYDCTKKPNPTDKSSVARIKYITFNEYEKEWDFLWDTFSKEAVLKGSFDKFLSSTANKKGTATVDKEFLQSLDQWRTLLAENISKDNKTLDEDELNFVVQQTLDRIIFLRICEDRSIEPYGNLQTCLKTSDFYNNLLLLFKQADDKYNSGLFDFKKDTLSHQLIINNKSIKAIINELYYPACPYEFSVLSVEILGSAYEQFLGKTITINSKGKAVIELKPEVRKAGGVYYTPQYIVEYIVKNTIGKLTENKTPTQVASIKIVDPACGSGSFLLGAYDFLLTWHKDYYTQNPNKKNPITIEGNLTTGEKKKILLNNIYGVDIDTNAIEVTKLSLLLKCMEGETQASIAHQMTMFAERVLPTLEDNIKSGNSLIDTDYYVNEFDFGEDRKIKPFSWQNAFPDVFNRDVPIDTTLPFKIQFEKVEKMEKETKNFIDSIVSEPEMVFGKKQNGGFDVVIGNPPYVKVSEKSMINYFIEKFYHQDYQQDLYLLFLEKYHHLLITGGKLGIIIPNTWLQSIKFRNIRRYLINNFYWDKILTFNNRVFDAIVDTHVSHQPPK